MNNNTSQNNAINITISQTALSGIRFKESIDLALVCAAFEQRVNLIFSDLGVNNLVNSQNYNALNEKNHLDILKGLEFYEIENIYAEKESLESLLINQESLIEQCKVLSRKEIKKLYAQSNATVNL